MATGNISTPDSVSLTSANPRLGKVEAVYSAVPTDEGSDGQPSANAHGARWYERVLLDTWVPEYLAMAFSTICLIAIVAVCVAYNGKTTPHLPYGVTLNAVVSTLATASRSSLIYVVAASISQLKWCWFKTEARPLRDIQIYDDASRGPAGSLMMLVYLRARPLASIAAVITIFALALDPFVQQILRYPSRVVTDSASAPQLTRALSFAANPRSNEWLNAVQFGIYSDPSQFDRRPGCSTGNCRWPNFESAGWCAKCEDATPYAHFVSGCSPSYLTEWGAPGSNENRTTCVVSLGPGIKRATLYHGGKDNDHIPVEPGEPEGVFDSTPTWKFLTDLVWATESNASTILGVASPLVSIARVSTDYVPSFPGQINITKAEQCVLTLCSQKYNVTVENGTTHSVAHGEPSYGLVKPLVCNDTFYPEYIGNRSCWSADGKGLPPPNPRKLCSATPDITPNRVCLNALDGSYSDGYDYRYGYSNYKNSVLDAVAGNRTYDSNWGNFRFSSPAVNAVVSKGLSATMDGIAASLSHLALSNITHTAAVEGNVMAMQTYVDVTLEWLILPLLLEAGGIAILICAVLQSRRCKVRSWKSSLLPLLFHGLERHGPVQSSAGEGEYEAAPEDTSAMSSVAEQVRVRLGWSGRQTKSVLKVM